MCRNNRTLTFSGFDKSTICYHAFNLHLGVCVCSTSCPGLFVQSCCTSSVHTLTVRKSELITSSSPVSRVEIMRLADRLQSHLQCLWLTDEWMQVCDCLLHQQDTPSSQRRDCKAPAEARREAMTLSLMVLQHRSAWLTSPAGCSDGLRHHVTEQEVLSCQQM